jgi:lysozyme
MQANGILRGAYHVLTPDFSASAHLRNIEDAHRNGPAPDFVVIDVELDKGQTPSTIKSVLYDVLVGTENLGWKNKTFIYTAAWFWDSKVGQGILSGSEYKPAPKDWALWVADYGANDGNLPARMPRLPVSWSEWWVWQYTDRGRVPGINANVDLNVMKDSYFRQLGGEGTPPPPPPPVGDLEERVEELERQVANIKTWGESFPA